MKPGISFLFLGMPGTERGLQKIVKKLRETAKGILILVFIYYLGSIFGVEVGIRIVLGRSKPSKTRQYNTVYHIKSIIDHSMELNHLIR